ncbi:hypothetical protein D3C87_1838070 [compost metagenome]
MDRRYAQVDLVQAFTEVPTGQPHFLRCRQGMVEPLQVKRALGSRGTAAHLVAPRTEIRFASCMMV